MAPLQPSFLRKCPLVPEIHPGAVLRCHSLAVGYPTLRTSCSPGSCPSPHGPLLLPEAALLQRGPGPAGRAARCACARVCACVCARGGAREWSHRAASGPQPSVFPPGTQPLLARGCTEVLAPSDEGTATLRCHPEWRRPRGRGQSSATAVPPPGSSAAAPRQGSEDRGWRCPVPLLTTLSP